MNNNECKIIGPCESCGKAAKLISNHPYGGWYCEECTTRLVEEVSNSHAYGMDKDNKNK